MDYSKKKNIKTYYGPGVWFVIHKMAIRADTFEKQKEFKHFIDIFIGNNDFFCEKCEKHALEFIKKHPMKDYVKNSKNSKLKLFEWTVMWHNYVNESKGYPIMAFEEAYELYNKKNNVKDKTDKSACINCFNSDSETEETKEEDILEVYTLNDNNYHINNINTLTGKKFIIGGNSSNRKYKAI